MRVSDLHPSPLAQPSPRLQCLHVNVSHIVGMPSSQLQAVLRQPLGAVLHFDLIKLRSLRGSAHKRIKMDKIGTELGQNLPKQQINRQVQVGQALPGSWCPGQ